MSKRKRVQDLYYRYCSSEHPERVLCLASSNFAFQDLDPLIRTTLKNAIEVNKSRHFGPFAITGNHSLRRLHKHDYRKSEMRSIGLAILKEYRHTGQLRDLNLFLKFTQEHKLHLPIMVANFAVDLNQ
jgi:hypothetical protein